MKSVLLLLLATDGGIQVYCQNGARPHIEQHEGEWLVCDARPDGGTR